nr:immunoglobulin light chain junction region [Macaca mulatta]
DYYCQVFYSSANMLF